MTSHCTMRFTEDCVDRGAGATGAAGAAAPPALCLRGQRGQLCPFLIEIELFYHSRPRST